MLLARRRRLLPPPPGAAMAAAYCLLPELPWPPPPPCPGPRRLLRSPPAFLPLARLGAAPHAAATRPGPDPTPTLGSLYGPAWPKASAAVVKSARPSQDGGDDCDGAGAAASLAPGRRLCAQLLAYCC